MLYTVWQNVWQLVKRVKVKQQPQFGNAQNPHSALRLQHHYSCGLTFLNLVRLTGDQDKLCYMVAKQNIRVHTTKSAHHRTKNKASFVSNPSVFSLTSCLDKDISWVLTKQKRTCLPLQRASPKTAVEGLRGVMGKTDRNLINKVRYLVAAQSRKVITLNLT